MNDLFTSDYEKRKYCVEIILNTIKTRFNNIHTNIQNQMFSLSQNIRDRKPLKDANSLYVQLYVFIS